MVTIAAEALEPVGAGLERWAAIAARIASWAQAGQIDLRYGVVPLPLTELLPHARHAWAVQLGWMPRIETTRAVAAALGPPLAPEPWQVSGDAEVDTLLAAELMRSQAWGAAWARRDRRGFARAVGTVVDTAHALVRASAAWPASERPQRWAAAREQLPATPGLGGTERMLVRVALAWAWLAAAPVGLDRGPGRGRPVDAGPA